MDSDSSNAVKADNNSDVLSCIVVFFFFLSSEAVALVVIFVMLEMLLPTLRQNIWSLSHVDDAYGLEESTLCILLKLC